MDRELGDADRELRDIYRQGTRGRRQVLGDDEDDMAMKDTKEVKEGEGRGPRKMLRHLETPPRQPLILFRVKKLSSPQSSLQIAISMWLLKCPDTCSYILAIFFSYVTEICRNLCFIQNVSLFHSQ